MVVGVFHFLQMLESVFLNFKPPPKTPQIEMDLHIIAKSITTRFNHHDLVLLMLQNMSRLFNGNHLSVVYYVAGALMYMEKLKKTTLKAFFVSCFVSLKYNEEDTIFSIEFFQSELYGIYSVRQFAALERQLLAKCDYRMKLPEVELSKLVSSILINHN